MLGILCGVALVIGVLGVVYRASSGDKHAVVLYVSLVVVSIVGMMAVGYIDYCDYELQQQNDLFKSSIAVTADPGPTAEDTLEPK